MKAYSNDLRRRIIAAYETGDYSQDEIAELFGVCQKTVSNFVTRFEHTGSPDQLAHGGGRQPDLDDQARLFIAEQVKLDNDITLTQLGLLVEQNCKTKVSKSTLSRVLQKLDLPRKKSRFKPVNATRQE